MPITPGQLCRYTVVRGPLLADGAGQRPGAVAAAQVVLKL